MRAEGEESENKRLARQIGERLRAFREHLSLSQERFAFAMGGTKRAIQNNEAGSASPNSKLLRGLAAQGINLNWLLTGKGEMLLAEVERLGKLDVDLLTFSIEMADAELAERKKKHQNPHYAELIVQIYNFCHNSGTRDPSKVKELFAMARSAVHLLDAGPASDGKRKIAHSQEDRSYHGRTRTGRG